MFNDSHHFSISGGTFSNIQVDTTVDKSAKSEPNGDMARKLALLTVTNPEDLRILQQATAPGASHDSAERYPPPKCHPKTREAILNTILSWTENYRRPSSVLWLYGPAGAGKSAIAQTAAEICRDKKWLAASFFFSRSSKDRNTEHHLVATLAYQLAIAIPEAKDVILKVVEEDPSIFFKSVEVQAKELLLSPISKAYHGADPKKWPKLVIIDGLDECTGHEMQCRILRIIYEVLSKDFPFCVLVCSRPEPVIRDEFLASELGEITQKLALDDSYQARADIFVFLSSGFDKIHDKHQRLGTMTHVSKPWPPIHTIDALVFKSSGHFIYAATVLKFVDNPRQHPIRRLDIIMGISSPSKNSESPFSDIDLLYKQVLMSVNDRETLMCIISAMLCLKTAEISFIEKLLGLFPGEIHALCADVHSIIFVPDPTDTSIKNPTLTFHHASFSEFLVDERRSGEFFINLEEKHRELASSFLDILKFGLSHHIVSGFNVTTDPLAWYAWSHWQHHFIQSPKTVETAGILAPDTVVSWVRSVCAADAKSLNTWSSFRIESAVKHLDHFQTLIVWLKTTTTPPDVMQSIQRYFQHTICQQFHSAISTIPEPSRKNLLWALAVISCESNDRTGYNEQGNLFSALGKPYRRAYDKNIFKLQLFRNFMSNSKLAGEYHISSTIHNNVALSLSNYFITQLSDENSGYFEAIQYGMTLGYGTLSLTASEKINKQKECICHIFLEELARASITEDLVESVKLLLGYWKNTLDSHGRLSGIEQISLWLKSADNTTK